MKTILHIVSSPRAHFSYSKGLSSAIVKKLLDNKVAETIIERDLSKQIPPLMTEALIGEFYKLPHKDNKSSSTALDYANQIFNELKAADIIVIGTPMYNLSVSASLKAWIDQLIRIGVTYGYTPEGKREGFLKAKKLYLSIASGGKLSDQVSESTFAETYLKEVFKTYTGISDISTFRVEGTAQPDFTADYQKIISNL